jgi:hypothetical protein
LRFGRLFALLVAVIGDCNQVVVLLQKCEPVPMPRVDAPYAGQGRPSGAYPVDQAPLVGSAGPPPKSGRSGIADVISNAFV